MQNLIMLLIKVSLLPWTGLGQVVHLTYIISATSGTVLPLVCNCLRLDAFRPLSHVSGTYLPHLTIIPTIPRRFIHLTMIAVHLSPHNMVGFGQHLLPKLHTIVIQARFFVCPSPNVPFQIGQKKFLDFFAVRI